MQEARKHPTEKPRAVEVATAIRGVEMKTGEFVAFSEPTGDYRPQTRELAGINLSGDSVIVPLKQTRSVHVRPVDHSTRENKIVPTDKFFRTYSANAAPASGKRTYPLKTRVDFNRQQGLIDTLRNCVSGTSKAHIPISIDCDNVFRLEYKRFSLEKTLISIVVVAGMVAAELALIDHAMRNSEWTSDSNDRSY